MAAFIKYDIEPPAISGESELKPWPRLPVLEGAKLLETFTIPECKADSRTEVENKLASIESEANGKWDATKPDNLNVYCYESSGPVRARYGNQESWGSGGAIGTNIVLTAGHVIHPGNGGRPYGRSGTFLATPSRRASTMRLARTWRRAGHRKARSRMTLRSWSCMRRWISSVTAGSSRTSPFIAT